MNKYVIVSIINNALIISGLVDFYSFEKHVFEPKCPNPKRKSTNKCFLFKN